jgi:tRNA A-37 threonylcarbamoyl transferase component Bud32
MSDLTGQRLGQYQILARVGKGSVSTIYKAYQPKLDRFVAVKVLSPHVVDEEGFLERFTQEARAVAQLDHPNIVPVYDFDQVGDIAYIVLKYVESGTLRSMMTGKPLELDLVLDIITQVGLALGYAHRHDVIHRDVKPSNILVGEGRWALLTDFGLAKILGGGRQLTRSGVGMGTPDYMAPEQAQGLAGDGRADLYSLGVMLYEMTTGRVPFEAESSMAVVVKHITESPPSPGLFNPELLPAVEQVILTAMEKDPSLRFQTAEKMVTALVCAAGRQERATMPVIDMASWGLKRPTESKTARKPRSIQAAGWWKRATGLGTTLSRRARLAFGAAALILLVALLAVGGSLVLSRPAAPVGALPTVAPTQPLVTATVITLTPAPALTTTSLPTIEPTSTPRVIPTETPMLIYLSPSAKIRPGIYVRAVKPDGVVLRKGASYDMDYLTTLSQNTILYVLQGPVRGDNLWWVQLSGGRWTGWAVQDEVVAYAIKPTPTP